MLIGTDPEVFAVETENDIPDLGEELLPYDNEFVVSPAVMMRFMKVTPVGGDVKHPVMLDRKHYKWIMDGCAFELNLKQPEKDPFSMWVLVQTALEDLEAWLYGFRLKLRKTPVVNFNYKKWDSPELKNDIVFQQGIIFGCDPDKDAFNVDWLCKILDNSKHPLRYGGGHFHFSGVPAFEKYPIPAVKLLALTVGNYVNMLSPYLHLEEKRAKYYGKPGKYRIQHYKEGDGIEYRTPSNSWLSYTVKQYMGIWEMVEKAIYFLENPTIGKEVLDTYETDTINAITTSDQKLSQKVLINLC
jgi:hypothetical protein